MRTHGGSRLLADNGQNRHVIEAGIIEPSNQVGGSWARGCEAHPEFAGELGVRASHKGSHFLVPRLNEFDVAVPRDCRIFCA